MKTTEKHTPGPWFATGRYIGTKNHKSFIAECRDRNGNWSDETPASDNARLIAAAPELLEAAHELFAFVAIMVGSGPDATIPETIATPLGAHVKIGQIMRDAQAAIAKATTLRDAAEKAVVPVVRGLVWDGRRAETVFGRYLVWPDPWSAGDLYEMRGPDCGDSDTLATADKLPTVEAAKAAAQADCEQRITSALNPDFLSELDTARAEIERLREALTPSGDTKAAYMGEFYMDIARMDEAGDGYTESIAVSWTTIKEIMAAINARATLSPAVKEPK